MISLCRIYNNCKEAFPEAKLKVLLTNNTWYRKDAISLELMYPNDKWYQAATYLDHKKKSDTVSASLIRAHDKNLRQLGISINKGESK
jgi:hypothetical protein